ncbi:hypothetical protein PDTK01_29530 [Phycicoccus sp. DTK01]|nr:hypothetical protein PDTK01_29530 [Phycicoccus sp. DTK01]
MPAEGAPTALAEVVPATIVARAAPRARPVVSRLTVGDLLGEGGAPVFGHGWKHPTRMPCRTRHLAKD